MAGAKDLIHCGDCYLNIKHGVKRNNHPIQKVGRVRFSVEATKIWRDSSVFQQRKPSKSATSMSIISSLPLPGGDPNSALITGGCRSKY